MKTTKLFVITQRFLIGLVATGLALGSIASPANAAAAVISTTSTIEDSDVNPTLIITSTGFDRFLTADDFTIDFNQTGLTLDTVNNGATTATLTFSGVALRGNIQITANTSAFTSASGFTQSNTLDVFVSAKTLPACSGTPTEPCVNAGVATETATSNTRAFEVSRANPSLSGGAYANFQFAISDGSNFVSPADGDTFNDVEILYPAADAIGADLKTASFAMAAVDGFEFSKTLVDISGTEFVKFTMSFTTRMVTNKIGCDRETNTFGSGANSVCEAENGDYINLVADSVDIFSPGSMPGLTSTGDGGFVVWVGSTFSWGSPSETEPFQFQLVGPKFRPLDRSLVDTTTTSTSEVTPNAGALKIFLPTALATTLYGTDFNPVLTRKDNLAGTVVENQLDASEGLVISEPAGGYLLEIASHPFSAPVFAVSNEVAVASTTQAPIVYSGPLIVAASSQSASAGDTVTISGQRLSGITGVRIDGEVAEVSNVTATSFDILIPAGLVAGSKDLVIESANGNLSYLDAFEMKVSEATEVSEQGTHTWSKKISDSSAKIYAKDIIGAGKVQFMFNGQEIAWVRALDNTDPKLRLLGDANYLVRTVDLVAGMKNTLEVYIDGERVSRTVYSR